MRVTVAMILKDPPLDRLALLIQYLREVSDDFVIVMDDRTSDDDRKVMEAWPDVRVFPFTWVDDFSVARNETLKYAKNDWVLHVDPDELPSFRMLQHIKEVTAENAPDEPPGWCYWTLNWWGGEKGPEEDYHWHVRLFRNGRGRWYRHIHELVELDGLGESYTRGVHARFAPKDALLIHSKPTSEITKSNEYYATLGSVSN